MTKLLRKLLLKSLNILGEKRISKITFLLSIKYYDQIIKKNHKDNFIKGNYSERNKFWEYIANTLVVKNKKLNYFEFGVYKGESLKWWANINNNKQSNFYGFDCFEGLPEDWVLSNKGKGTFNVDKKLPEIIDSRIEIIDGLFQKTLPIFFNNYNESSDEETITIVHYDADIFSSTVIAMSYILSNLRSKDIIFIFDEFPYEECYAFKIFCNSFKLNYKVLSAFGYTSSRPIKIAFKISRL